MKNPTISVIIPLYNKEPIIERTIKSVLNQSYSDFELIIVNDGSTDNSVEVVKRFDDDRIVLVEQENAGPSAARNAGIKKAKGEWIVFLDADDELNDYALEHFIYLINTQVGFEMYCCEFCIRNRSSITQQYHYQNEVIENGFKAWFYNAFCPRTGATIYSKKLLRECPFDERIRRYEDLECLFRMFHITKIYCSGFVVLFMNTDYASASSARKHIKEDFLGYLDFKGKAFWERMALYNFYLGERDYYKDEVKVLYPNLHHRYDLLLLYKCILLLKRIHVM